MTNIITDPAYLAYRLDFERECVEFLPVDRADLRRVAWLRLDALGADKERVAVPLAQLIEHLSARAEGTVNSPIRFIFHTAYCASTYLSRCLDVESRSLSLREPQILLDAANAKRLQWRSNSTNLTHHDLPALAIKLLAKHAYDGECLIVKPINSVNNIIAELLESVPDSRAVLLYTNARNFALSALRKGESSRQQIRAMFDLLRCDFPHLANLRISDAIHMSDLKIILTFWRLQMEQASAILNQHSHQGRLASLYAEDLITDPLLKITTVDEFLNLGLGNNQIETIINSEDSKRDAKKPDERFSVAKRSEEHAEIERIFGRDLDNGLNWMLKNNPVTKLVPKLNPGL